MEIPGIKADCQSHPVTSSPEATANGAAALTAMAFGLTPPVTSTPRQVDRTTRDTDGQTTDTEANGVVFGPRTDGTISPAVSEFHYGIIIMMILTRLQ